MTHGTSDDGAPDRATSAADSRLVEFDEETDSASETIVTTVAELADVPPTALDPLYGVVDPDALDAIVRSVATRPGPSDVKTTLRYHGYTVTVHGHGVVEVTPQRGD